MRDARRLGSRCARATALVLVLLAQAAASDGAGCECRVAFDDLVRKVEADYVGYHLGIRGRRDAEYRRHVRSLAARAARAAPDDCVRVLQDFVRFFRDGHLFVGQWPETDEAERARLASAAERTRFRTEADIRRELDRRAGRLDPIEGVWYAKDGSRVGVVRDPKPGRRDFVAVILATPVEGWEPGQVKAEFRRLGDGSYDAVLYADDHSPRRPDVYSRGERGGAAVRRGVLLHMPPTTWGKAYPLAADERGALDPTDPRRPTARVVDDSTVVVSVPSHVPEYAPVLKELVDRFADRIVRAETLVVDLRGDEGGSAWMTDVLMPYIVTTAKRPPRYWREGRASVLSSPDNIAYFERASKEGWAPAGLVDRMRANPGRVVAYDSGAETPDEEVAAAAGPRRVAILVDGGVVSAGEAFVLSAMRNEKVVLFGENTGGVIDYQSTQIVGIGSCRRLGFGLGVPTVAASDRLPRGGANAAGIPPDVRIPRGVRDPVRFVIDYVARSARK